MAKSKKTTESGAKKSAPKKARAAKPKAADKKAARKSAPKSEAPLAAGSHPGCLTAEDNGDNSFTIIGEGGGGLEAAYRVDAPPASSDPRTLVVDPPGPGSMTVVTRPILAGKAEVTVNVAGVDANGPGPFVLSVSAEVVDDGSGGLKVSFPGSSCKG